MKRSEMIDIIEAELYMIQNIKGNNQKFLTSIAKGILERLEEAGMLPPERPDEHPLGYGGGWLDEDEVELNYKLFKHSWEPEDA